MLHGITVKGQYNKKKNFFLKIFLEVELNFRKYIFYFVSPILYTRVPANIDILNIVTTKNTFAD